ncbi:Zinc finger CCCH domain-containing protein 53 [Platanthera zijinensis]|uniref:Zinc finger CCCH domain-containing protein 53 n=1 Tax=Platanthera zijinensis TaxID=2320716 RepID=A0AAP0BD35_9ASPA
MDAYEATRIVFSRIQNLDPENAAKIMGLLLIQDHGEKEMIRLAFGPEALLHSVVIKVRKDLCLLPYSSPATPSSAAAVPVFSRQNSARFLPVSPSSWSAAPPFSRTSAVPGDDGSPEDYPPMVSPGDLIDDLQLHDQLSFLNEGANLRTKTGDFFYSDIIGDLCCPPSSAAGDGMLLSNSMGWGRPNGTTNRRTTATAAAITDLSLNPELSCAGFGWRPCLYFARGFCKNGNACRFLHDDAAADQELLLLRSKSSKLMASAASFPYSPTSTIPPPSPSYSAKYMNFLLQQQHDGHRAAAAALMLNNGGGSDDQMQNFMGRTRSEFAGISNPGSRQIYLTFPADSTFREEDVSNYFSIYGPVQDVRIPYQQKRMFGFVTFLYPETVKLILAKGNPHFVCDARVLVKPYKEKGKVSDKKQQQADQRLDFSGCRNSPGLDSSPIDLGGRMFYSDGAQDASLLRRRLEEDQQAELLQQAIELQGRRFQLMDLNLKPRSFSTAVSATTLLAAVSPAKSADEQDNSAELQLQVNNNEESQEELRPKEDHDFPVCTDLNLPESPFASPTKPADRSFSTTSNEGGAGAGAGNHLPFSPLSSCFFQSPARFSPGHGAVGM